MTPDEPEHKALPMRGSVVDGRYEVVELVGQGGFGWVFEVRHRLLGQRFAMKILNPTIARDRDWIARFREEAKATSLIGHESIVFVTDFGACPRYGYYFVMEFLEGQTLGDYLLERPRYQADLGLVRQFAMTAASALGAVHELDIVHCDLKPTNVMMVQRRGQTQFRFLDFGTSTLVVGAGQDDVVLGTPAYMAPEQSLGLAVDARADQFSLGCIVYEMIAGRVPWVTRKWEDAFPEPRSKNPPEELDGIRADVESSVHTVVMKALSLGRSARWPDVESFVEALLEALPVESGEAFEPMDDPFDSIRVASGFERSLSAPRVMVPQDGASMIIEVDPFDPDASDEFASARFEVNVVYRTANRLRREWRRNVIAGGLFLPSATRPAIGSLVRINLTYLPGQTSVELDAEVVSHRDGAEGEAMGFGVRFEADGADRFRRFVRDLQLGLELSHNDMLRRIRDFDPDAPLSAGEAFILSRLDQPVPFGRIRAICSGLPFDVDECVDSLLDRGWLRAEPQEFQEHGLSEVTEIFEQEPSSSGRVHLSDDEISQANETVNFFLGQKNFLAAFHVLKNAISLAPRYVDFYAKHAEIAYRFMGDLDTAKASIDQALELAPERGDLKKLASVIEAAREERKSRRPPTR